eukprot:5642575-Pyramimonas_sp.AAC.2
MSGPQLVLSHLPRPLPAFRRPRRCPRPERELLDPGSEPDTIPEISRTVRARAPVQMRTPAPSVTVDPGTDRGSGLPRGRMARCRTAATRSAPPGICFQWAPSPT